jgi:hypothetical protein
MVRAVGIEPTTHGLKTQEGGANPALLRRFYRQEVQHVHEKTGPWTGFGQVPGYLTFDCYLLGWIQIGLLDKFASNAVLADWGPPSPLA